MCTSDVHGTPSTMNVFGGRPDIPPNGVCAPVFVLVTRGTRHGRSLGSGGGACGAGCERSQRGSPNQRLIASARSAMVGEPLPLFASGAKMLPPLEFGAVSVLVASLPLNFKST